MKRSWLYIFLLITIDLLLLREWKFLALFIFIIALYIAICITRTQPEIRRKYGDIIIILLTFIALWTVFTKYMILENSGLYPQPIVILDLLITDFPRFILNFAVSIRAFSLGVGAALLTGLTVGISLGLNERIRTAVNPYVKLIGGVSPIAYVPYIIGIMPTFWYASVFVIFFGTVWHVIKWTMYGIGSLDRNIYTGAKLMNVSRAHFLTGVLLPGIMPSVLEGVSQAITAGFSVLIAAEMIGSRNGLGFYIKYYADFLNYPKVITGIIYLGISICIVTWLLDRVKKRLLYWQA